MEIRFTRMRRHTRHRILRNMRVLRHEPRHAAQAEARAEPVDQMRQFFGVVGPAKPVCTGSTRSVTSAESRTMS